MRKRHPWRTIRIFLLVVWLFAVFGAFHVVQKPFTAQTAQAVARSALDVATATLLTIVGAGLGHRILVWLSLQDLDVSDQVWLAPGLGLGLLSLVAFGLGLVGGWLRPAAYALVVASCGLLAWDILAVARQIGTWRPQPTLGKWGHRYLLTTLILTLLLSLAPPTSWDALLYHLQGPALYIDQGAITALDVNIPHLAFPSLTEMLFGFAMLLRGDVAAKLIHLAYGLLLAALVYRLTRRWLSEEAAGWSLLLLAGMPMMTVLAAWAYNDLTLAFYQVAALYALLAWRDNRRWGWLVVAGLLTGLALGVKYTSFPLPLLGLVYVIWQSRRGRRAVVVFVISTTLVACPWYLRNWASTGNPVYPFLFSGRNWDSFRSAWYAHAGSGIGWKPLQILALPATVTLGLRDINYYDGRMGPLFLALAPVLVWLAIRTWQRRGSSSTSLQRHQAFMLLGGFASLHGVIWTLGVVQSRALFQGRLLLPCFVALVPLMAEGMVRLPQLDHPRFSISAFVKLAVGVVLALALLHQALGMMRFQPLQYLVGYESRVEYLRRVLGDHYRAMEELEQAVPEDGRVLLLWEPRSYHSPRRVEPDAILDNWAHLVYLHGDEDAIAAHLRREGYSHVLLNERGLDFVIREGESPLSAVDVERLERFIDEHLQLSETIGSYRLYALQE